MDRIDDKSKEFDDGVTNRPTCGNCKHWEQSNNPLLDHCGKCKLTINDGSVPAWKRDYENSPAQASTLDHHPGDILYLFTHNTFYCNQWEQ